MVQTWPMKRNHKADRQNVQFFVIQSRHSKLPTVFLKGALFHVGTMAVWGTHLSQTIPLDPVTLHDQATFH